MITLLLSLTASFALDGQVAIETGVFDVGGRELASIAGPGGLTSGGLRFAVAANDHLSVVAGWHYGSRGAIVDVPDSMVFTAAFRAHEVSVGAQVDVDPTDVVSPYLLVEALALPGTVLFDGDSRRADNATQDKRSGFTGGGAALIGCDVHAKQGGASFAPAAFLEVGYAYAAPLALGDYGKIPVHGVIARLGAGVRF